MGHAVSSPKRLELLDLLSQGEKTVEKLAEESSTALKNTSSHLRVLRQARLVETRREGQWVWYRLADEAVATFLLSLQALGHQRYAEIRETTELYLERRDSLEPIPVEELRRRMDAGDVTLIDVRPADEFAAGHLPGALSIPLPELSGRLRELPRRKEIVAYCRGVSAWRARGYRVSRSGSKP